MASRREITAEQKDRGLWHYIHESHLTLPLPQHYHLQQVAGTLSLGVEICETGYVDLTGWLQGLKTQHAGPGTIQ